MHVPDGFSIQTPGKGANRVKIAGDRLCLARTLEEQSPCQKKQSEHAEGAPGNEIEDSCECPGGTCTGTVDNGWWGTMGS